MERASAESRWDHTSSLIAATLNAGLRPKRVFKPEQFHPFKRSKPPSVAEAIRMMRPANDGQRQQDERAEQGPDRPSIDRNEASNPPKDKQP